VKNSGGRTRSRSETAVANRADPEELKAVDSFRFLHRMPSRAAAVRELLRHGLAAVVIRKQGSKTHSFFSRDGHLLSPPSRQSDRLQMPQPLAGAA
jgi:hypothetical protein